jgi:hypothetical protein
MRIVRGHGWAWGAAALAASLAFGLSWCIVRSPLTLYDGLGPILDSHRAASVREMFEGALYSAGYWRPLRMTQIKLVVDASSADPTLAFKAIHVALTFATFLLFAAWLRPRSLPEFTAASIAIMILAGHHSFFILFGEAYPINHFLEIVALALAIAALARGEPRWWKDVLAPVLLIVGALTIESGLLIGVAAVVCWIVGWRGLSLRGIAAVAVVLAAYFWVRFLVLEISSPGLDERASGWGFTRLEPRELLERFGANPLPFYAYNVTSALLDVLWSEPRGGSWGFVESVLINHDVKPWMVIHIAASLIVTGAMLMALPPAVRRWQRGCLTDRDRFLLAAFALVGANSVLSFGYVKDEVLSVGAAFYAAGAFAALANIGDRVREHGRACARAALLLVCASVLWSTRAAGTFFSLETYAYKTATDWALYSLERELPADWAFEPTRRAFLELRHRNLQREVPHPAFINQDRVERYLEIR